MIENLEVNVCLIFFNLHGYTSFLGPTLRLHFCSEHLRLSVISISYTPGNSNFMTHLNVPALFLKCAEKDSVSLPNVDDTSQVIQNNMMVQMWPSKIRSPFPLHVCTP